MIECQYIQSSFWDISNINDLADIIIATLGLFLGYYIFVYQKNKDRSDSNEALHLQERNIRLQWFKELIIQPHLKEINKFYKDLYLIESLFINSPLDEEEKNKIISDIKLRQSALRKSFVDLLLSVHPSLYHDVKKNLDDLVDTITNAIYSEELSLNNRSVFEKEIGSKITYSRNDLIGKIYNYKGI